MEAGGRVPPVGMPESTRHGLSILLLPDGAVGGAVGALCRDSVCFAGQGKEIRDRLRPISRHYVTTPCVIPGHLLGTRRSEPPGTVHRLRTNGAGLVARGLWAGSCRNSVMEQGCFAPGGCIIQYPRHGQRTDVRLLPCSSLRDLPPGPAGQACQCGIMRGPPSIST